MRHRKRTAKLGRTSEHRNMMLANLVCCLIKHRRVTTTLAKARAARPVAEKMVTLGKSGTLHDRRLAAARLHQEDPVRILFSEIAPTQKDRPGGYTRIIKLNQRDQHVQLIVIDVSESKDQLRVFINPRIVWAAEETMVCEEGCLSVPGIYDEVRRPARVRVQAQDAYGKAFELECEGLLAVCVQHEMDHLTGKVFVDYLSALKQDRIRTKMKKRKGREAA